jgi:uncharacterized protein (UPF0264 family)
MKLLISVRSAEEALAAVDGGADVIDIKEPSRGSLGRADDAIVGAVLQLVAGRRMVSAACGELLEGNACPMQRYGTYHLSYVKWGLAGCAHHNDWPHRLVAKAQSLPITCRPVMAAYADWRRSESPTVEEACAFACERPMGAFLIDTWRKDGTTLLDHLRSKEIEQLVHRCRDARVPIALAGSLGAPQIRELWHLAPDWFAVRAAACRDGERGAAIDVARVRQLVDLMRPKQPATSSIS